MSLFIDSELTSANSVLEPLTDSETELLVRVPLLLTLERSIVCYGIFIGEGAEERVSSLCNEDTVTSVEIINRPANALLAAIELPLRSGSLIGYIANSDVEVVEAVNTPEKWLFRLRCPNYETLHEFIKHGERSDYRVHVERVYEPVGDRTLFDARLTRQQEDTLRIAYEAGYFRVPRETSLKQLSSELGVSDSAVSQRLRRGTYALLSTLFERTERDHR